MKQNDSKIKEQNNDVRQENKKMTNIKEQNADFLPGNKESSQDQFN